jgi:hypothetical protein
MYFVSHVKLVRRKCEIESHYAQKLAGRGLDGRNADSVDLSFVRTEYDLLDSGLPVLHSPFAGIVLGGYVFGGWCGGKILATIVVVGLK